MNGEPAGWRPITEQEPKFGDIVWLFDGAEMWIGGRELEEWESWRWGNTYGSIWHACGKWDGDLETDDDYKPVLWMPLPEPPATGKGATT